MKLSPEVKAIRDAYVARFPVPHGEPGEALEEQCRQWCIGVASQVKFTTGDPAWGVKRADPGRPISKDTIAFYRAPTLLIWDLITGAATGHGELVADPDSEDVTGQTFVPVMANDVLGQAPAPPPSQPPQPPTPSDGVSDAELVVLLKVLIDVGLRVAGSLQALSERLDQVKASGIRIHL